MQVQRHQGEQFSQSLRDSARALLVIERLSSVQCARRLADLHPDERIPDQSTLRLWRSSFAEISVEESALIEQNERERILQIDSMIMPALESVTDHEWTLKNLIALNAIRGTDMDKQLKRRQLAQPQQDNRQLVIVVNNPMSSDPLTIDLPITTTD